MSRVWPPGTKHVHGPRSAPMSEIRDMDLVRIKPDSTVQPKIPEAVGLVEMIEEGSLEWVAEILWTEEHDARRLLPPRLALRHLEKIHPLERLAVQSE